MIRRILLLIISAIISISLLASCSIGNGGSDGGSGAQGGDGGSSGDGGNGSTDSGSSGGGSTDTVTRGGFLSSGSTITLVTGQGYAKSAEYNALKSALEALEGVTVRESDDSSAPTRGEIIYGPTTRQLSKSAYKRLSRLNPTEDELLVGYMIYSDGESVAIAFDDGSYPLPASESVACKEFSDRYIEKDGELSVGSLASESFDYIEYQAALDAEETAKKWEELRELVFADLSENLSDKIEAAGSSAYYLTEDIIDALQNHYSIFSDDVISWFANLYDPDTGGFYYSNSGRDTVQYAPDLESTRQILSFIQSVGMLKSIGDRPADVVPAHIAEDIVRWVKGLQHENGYFYHPQWGKELTDQYLSRRGRDLQWGVQILGRFGYKPTYDTPLGDKGDGIDANGKPISGAPVSYRGTTVRLGTPSAIMVSRLNSSAAAVLALPSHMRSREAFEAYLMTLRIEADSYEVGNTLESQAKQIYNADKVLRDNGADYSLCDILKEWLDSKQNPETGLWTVYNEVDYDGVNGLLKISGAYNGIQREIPNAVKGIRAAIETITDPGDPITVCYVLNPWYAIVNVMNNVKNYGAAEGKEALEEQFAELRAEMLLSYPELIRVTTQKSVMFLKTDGSFSYLQKSSGPTSQGLPVAVMDTNEGDVNATTIFIIGITHHIFEILEQELIPIYTESDRLRWVSILESLGTVIKDPVKVIEPVDFGAYEEGKVPDEVTYNTVLPDASVAVEKINRDGVEESVLALKTVPDSNETLRFTLLDSAFSFNAVTFEADMMFKAGQGSGSFDCFFRNGSGADVFRFLFDYTDTSVSVRSIGNFNSIKIADTGEWFRIRLDYSLTDIDYDRDGVADLLVKVFVNGTHIATGYYPYNNTYASTKNVQGLRFFSWGAADTTVYFDNLVFMQSTVEIDKGPETNAEDTLATRTFEHSTESSYPNRIIPTLGSGTLTFPKVKRGTDTRVLALTTPKDSQDALTFGITKKEASFNAVAIDTFINVTPTEGGGAFELEFLAGTQTAHKIILEYDAAGTLYATTSKDYSKVKIGECGDWIKLRIEYSSTGRDYDGDGDEEILSKLYAGSRLKATAYSPFSSAIATRNITHVKLTSWASTAAAVYLDNLTVEQLNVKIDDKADIESSEDRENPENSSENLTYDGSVGANLPSAVTGTLSSTGSLSAEIVESKEGNADKALAFVTPAGNIDKLFFALTKTHESANTVIFSTDVKIFNTSHDNYLYIYLKDAEGNIAHKIILGDSASTTNIFVQDQYLAGNSTGRTYNAVIVPEGVGKWWNMRLEYADSDDGIVFKFYVDGTLAVSSTVPYDENKVVSAKDIAVLELESYQSRGFTAYFNDTSFRQMEYVDPNKLPDGLSAATTHPTANSLGNSYTVNAPTVGFIGETTDKVVTLQGNYGQKKAILKIGENTEAAEGADILELNMKLKISWGSNSTSAEFFNLILANSEGKTAFNMVFRLTSTRDNLGIVARTSSGALASRTFLAGANGTEFDLKITYALTGTDELEVKVYCNGTLSMTYTTPYDAGVYIDESDVTSAYVVFNGRNSSAHTVNGSAEVSYVTLGRVKAEEAEATE